MSRWTRSTAIASAAVAVVLAIPTAAAPASDLRAPVLTIDSFSSHKVVPADGSPAYYTFDFSASWTRAQDATLYVLCVGNLETANTCWGFPGTNSGFPDRPGAGVATLSFSAKDVHVGSVQTASGTFLITHLPFWVQAWSPIHGYATSDTVMEIVDTTT
jgi:hypothetical protein